MEEKDKSGKLLFSVKDVFSSSGILQMKNKSHYNIPHYQRGYKWEPQHVVKLLDDVQNFETSDGKFYCLQNITIVANGEHFNVIDGQQRLTTLTIILSYLKNQSLVQGKVKFPENSIRKFTNQFLQDVITNNETPFPNLNWKDFSEKKPEYDLQDISHIYNVYQAINNWFEEKLKDSKFSKERYCEKLLHDVRLIVNDVDERTSEEKVFGNLNSKRIPLDGSDLIRAILITRVAREEGRKESDIKNIVYVNERRVKLGWELDQINNWWGKEDVKGYFSKFVSNKSELIGTDKKLFNEDKYTINYLYLLFSEREGKPKLTLDLIERHNNDAIALYKNILKLHSTLQDWYEDSRIYHFLGILFTSYGKEKKETFEKIWRLWESSTSREDFISFLKGLLKEFFFQEGTLIDFHDNQINWYYSKPEVLTRTLIMMDVIHTIKTKHLKLPYYSFGKQSNDIEHIFPQNPGEINNKKKYVEFLNSLTIRKEDQFDLTTFEMDKNNETYLSKIEEYIHVRISEFKINSIGNLVLLDSKLNKSISNLIYSKKRSKIIEHHNKGNFIQPHTFKVFVRDFKDSSNSNIDNEFWSSTDITRNATFISQEISNFFQPIKK